MQELYLPLKFSEILLETEYAIILGNTLNNFTTPRKQSSGAVQVLSTKFIPSFDSNTLKIKATTKTKTNRYTTILLFDDVEYTDTPKPTDVKIIGVDTEEYYFKKIPLNRVDVKVNCSCLDFYYRFSIWNHGDDSLAGKPPPPYVKKTNRPPYNPRKLPGVCKHIIKLTDRMIQQKMFK